MTEKESEKMKYYKNTEEKLTVYQLYADRAVDLFHETKDPEYLNQASFYQKEIKEILEDIKRGCD